MSYADFDYYVDNYLKGRNAAVSEGDFPFFATAASQCIERFAGENMPKNAPDEVKMCCCELAEILFFNSAADMHRGLSGESVQGWSVSYENSQNRLDSLRISQRECIYKWLSGGGILYSGIK